MEQRSTGPGLKPAMAASRTVASVYGLRALPHRHHHTHQRLIQAFSKVGAIPPLEAAPERLRKGIPTRTQPGPRDSQLARHSPENHRLPTRNPPC
ncbi:hypothetical protein CHARACLAT_027948 [Characodon lateralis]|uniref:Uncharacterized protein n=1 Tax=Characodon lateralis TaxID=208331 RepID=A0ABU7F730_9TELE|nr:hypothetical protein [Characodon lateralis]